MTGFEPATSGATVRRSTAELHPPQAQNGYADVSRSHHKYVGSDHIE